MLNFIILKTKSLIRLPKILVNHNYEVCNVNISIASSYYLVPQAYVRHPELAAAKANRDFVFKQVCEAVNTISDVAQGKATGAGQTPYEGPGELASALDDFDVSLFAFFIIYPSKFWTKVYFYLLFKHFRYYVKCLNC